MKKNFKLVLALVLAIIMIAGMIPAMATGSISLDGIVTNLTAEEANKHEYKVYQIFTGDLVTVGTGDDAHKELQNVKYGANYGDTGASVPKTVLDTFTEANVKTKAKEIEAAIKGDPIKTLTASNNFSSGDLPEGYYLIVDDTSKELSDGDVYSTYIIQVLDTKTGLKVKKEVPSGDKVIEDDTLGPDTTSVNPTLVNGTANTDDVSIGDTVTFKLTGTVPATAVDYDYYFFIMNDTLSSGLTFDEATAAINVTIPDGDDADSDPDVLSKGTDYYVYTGNDCGGTPTKHTFEIAFADAKSLAGKTITVTYKATLNQNCALFDTANPNEYNITYSNNPKHDYDGDKDKNKPGKPDSTKDVPTGDTPKELTETFSTGIKIRKVDQDLQALKGAKFTIEGNSVEKIVHYNDSFEEATGADAKYWKLTNGTYTDQAPQTADEMIAASEGATDGYVLWTAAGTNAETDTKVTVGGVEYRVVHQGETPTHILKKKNSELYASTDTKYKKTHTKTVEDSTSHKSAELTVQDDGTLYFDGLGAGEYTITETKAPEGYTKAEPIKVTITFTENPGTGESHWTATGATKDAEGYFTVTVKNIAGNTLPSTGGIGTTIFYIGGSILVLAAVILLITKRRMGAND